MVRCLLTQMVLILAAAGPLHGAEDIAVETVIAGFEEPVSVAVRPGGMPERYEIFVADRAARRVVSVLSEMPTIVEAITNAEAADGAGTTPPFTPTAILFLERDRLLVGASTGGAPAILLYNLAGDNFPLPAEKPDENVEIRAAGDASATPHAIHAIARLIANPVVHDGVILTTVAENSSGGIWKIPVRAGTLDKLAPLGKDADLPRAPLAVTVGPRGSAVLSEATADGAAISFINPLEGTRSLKLATELESISSLAYSPATGSLYALATEGDDPLAAALYRIDDASEPARPACKAVRIVSLPGAWSMAFAPDGALLVTTTLAQDSPGALLKLTGSL